MPFSPALQTRAPQSRAIHGILTQRVRKKVLEPLYTTRSRGYTEAQEAQLSDG